MFGLQKRIILCQKLNCSINALNKCTTVFQELGQHHFPLRRSVSAISNSLEYKMIEPEHYDQVLVHMRKNFFPQEPMNKAAGLCQDGEVNPNLEQKVLDTMEDNLSLMAVDPDPDCCKIAGVVVNGILRPGDTAKALKDLERSCDLGFRNMFTMIYCLFINNDLFKKFDVDCIFDVRKLSVDSSYRGRGIGNELIKQSMALAKKKGFSLMKTDSTGVYSQKIFHSLGFEVHAEQSYDEYTDDNGQMILPVEAPHTKLELLYKQISEGTEDEQN
ncbi:dopamine N-acetyltransferase-like [Drosophila serrata]|uniref:dopamine N-acetyltransferase-like n=1 Tax=Drosophila serrata TaxID=7274 RepID=UPI000A1D0FB8|nr:dopamine N-acetyltransferase-like [Drosophila serrata]